MDRNGRLWKTPRRVRPENIYKTRIDAYKARELDQSGRANPNCPIILLAAGRRISDDDLDYDEAV